MAFKKIVREWKRVVRQVAIKAGVVSPYDNFDWKHSLASEDEIKADKIEYIRLNTDPSFAINPKREMIITHLKHSSGEHSVGPDTACFIRDLWGAKWIYRNLPAIHYDCGSSFERFIAHILPVGVKICLIDIRDLSNRYNTIFFNSLSNTASSDTSNINLAGGVTPLCFKDCSLEQIPTISCIQADATNLKEFPDNSIESLSSLGAFGLFGLGMYGDPICPDAWKLALQSFQRVLKKGGYLYLSCSLGKENFVHFNSGRVFTLQTILDILSELEVLEASYISHFDVIPIMYRENDTLKTDDKALRFMQSIERIPAVFAFRKPLN